MHRKLHEALRAADLSGCVLTAVGMNDAAAFQVHSFAIRALGAMLSSSLYFLLPPGTFRVTSGTLADSALLGEKT